MKIYTFTNGNYEPGVLVRLKYFSSDSIGRRPIPVVPIGLNGSYCGYHYEERFVEVQLASHEMVSDLTKDGCCRVFCGDIEDSDLNEDVFSLFSRRKIIACRQKTSNSVICLFEGWGNGEYGYGYPLGVPTEFKRRIDAYGVLYKKQLFQEFGHQVAASEYIGVDKIARPQMEPSNRNMLLAVIEAGGVFSTPTVNPMSRPSHYVWEWTGSGFSKIADINE